MTHRERIRAVVAGEKLDPPPVSIRIDLWHRDAVAAGKVPEEIRGLAREEVEDYLGFARAARFGAVPELVFGDAEVRVVQESDRVTAAWAFPERALTCVTGRTEEQRRQGIRGHIVEYPLQTREDYRLLLEHMDSARLEFSLAEFDAFDSATGPKGLPMLILGPGPAHSLMLNLAGYENFFLQRADFPEEVHALIDAIDGLFRRDVWPAVCGSSAEIVLHGSHFSAAMTPPPLFKELFLPYFREFNAAVHGCGKRVFWHADAPMGNLLDLVAEAGFDGADCLATAPLAPERLADYVAAWGDRIVCWGGLPSNLFDPMTSMGEFREATAELRQAAARGAGRIIVGASDNVMPGAQWEKLKVVHDAFAAPA